MPKADQRFFGSVGWSNIARTFEGWVTSYGIEGIVMADLYGLKVTESYVANTDRTAWGVYFNNLFSKGIDFFYHIDNFGEVDTDADGKTDAAHSRNTIGLHYGNTYFDKLGVTFNFGTQMGSNEWGGSAVDYAGMMYDLDLSWGLDLGFLQKIGFGYESMSGDSDAGDDQMEEWQELYPTAHKYHGYMDIAGPIFSGNNAGLNDIEINFLGVLPVGGLKYKLDYHMFSYAQDTGLENNTDLGSEIDFTLKKKMSNFAIAVGYSIFTPTDNLVNGGDPVHWKYIQFIAGWK